MSGGMYFTPEQIRSLPLTMQIQIGLGIAAQLSQAAPVAGQEKPKGVEPDAEMRSKGVCKMSL